MMRDSKLSRRNSGKNLNFEETENVPVNVNIRESSIRRMSIDSCSRPPLNSIQEPLQNPSKPAQESGFRSSKTHRTPTKAKSRHQEPAMTMRTPEKQGILARDRFGWGHDSTVNTPRSCRTLGRASLGFSELNSAHSTPTKTVTKPPNPGLIYGGNSRPPVRTGNFAALSKGIPVTSNTCTTVNTIEVPHFDLREDPSFWMDHNVQVLIRIRPLNGMEITSQGYNRCLKQESAQSLTWIGNPETRFTFDHVACETIDQETLFKMVGEPMVENCLSGYNSCMFAYGQTGSGKTHTMLGEINNLEVKPSPYRGMTPRIFEFLFSRILAEEGSRKNERLTYNCKCSFLEIYNEQITDLLDPSSTNLQLREDVKKGVYVENLTEFEVHTVGDILRLLSQGSANRRVASTNMNRESSRSHSVFTCVIESRWEKDSTSNLRFARLNLVDLAGSERQKSSGAEGERLKEAANINKSLSTLGHVIMVLVDGANARTKHVPYRDSRLTFLLQDSLGGNSKTMIIANVSPSISSATETLNTLKFAQRAKLIQNNAVINEDASGDVEALQHQIRLLKEELATLKRLNISRSLTNNSKNENCSNASSLYNYEDDEKVLRVSCKQLKSLETSLNGALRREQSTENSIKQLEEEIEQLNSLVHQREEENRCTKMMLKFREDKIQRMECLLSGSLTVDSYLVEENKMVNEEIKILRGKVDRNPEVTRFAVENIRLLEQLRRFQDFYEEGEREMLLTEVSELRDQLTLSLDENLNQNIEKECTEDKKQDDFLQLELEKSQKELEKCMEKLNSCLEKNSKLCREITDLNDLLEMQKSEVIKDDHSAHTVEKNNEILANNTKELLDLQLEVEILKIILKEERLIHGETDEKFLLITKQCENLKEELQEAKSVIEALEIQNLVSINELEDLKNNNNQYAEILHEKELEITSLNDKFLNQVSKEQTSLNKVQDSLEKAKKLNTFYQNDRVFHESNEEQMDEVRKQVEAETTEVIVCLQEELCNFQKKMQENSLKERETQQELIILQEKLDFMSECNRTLREKLEEKDRILFGLCEEIEDVLSVGDMALDDVLNKFVNGKQEWVSEKLQIIARNVYEKELRIEELNSCLEDAKRKSNEMESMLRSLRGAILVMSEAHQQDCNKKDQEIVHLSERNCSLLEALNHKDFAIEDAEKQIQSLKVESCCYLDKFLEADFMIKGMEIEISEMKKKEVFLIDERESYSILEEQIETDTISMKKEVEEIEHMILEIQAKNQDLIMPKSSDFDNIKSCVHDLLTWHEEIWCEIIAKDWVVSVLHLCHMGILMETMSGLNVEKSLLHHGLCESNALVSELKGQNCKSRKELEACSMLRGKLLVDIKNGFDRISRKEEETGNLSMKITNFEKKILDLQVMEDAMLERFNHMGNELFTIMKEIDVIGVIHDEDEENLVFDSSAKEIELFLKLEQMASINNDLEKEKFSISMELEKFKEDMIILFMDMQLKDAEVGVLKKEVEIHEEALKISSKNSFDFEMSSCKLQHELEMNIAELRLQKEENKRLSIMLKDQKHEIEAFEASFEDLQIEVYESVVKSYVLEAHLEMELETVLDEKNSLIDSLKEDLKTISCEKDEINGKLLEEKEEMASINNDLEKEKFSIFMELEKFKEDMIILFMDMQLKDAEVGVLKKEVEIHEEALKISSKNISDLEMNVAELRLQKEENKRLSIMLKDQKHEIEAFEASFEDLQCEVYESVVKSNVLEAHLENLQDDLKAKESIEMEMEIVLDEKNILIESLKEDLKTISCKRVEKEEELKLYEKSVEELECTANVLENQIKMVKGDAERQRMQREELELELHALKQSNDSVMQRDLDEKEKELQDLLRRNIVLQKEIISKDAEIIELNLQKVQSREYNEKIKAMEETPDENVTSPYNINRSGSRSKGQHGSPFKCIRLGFVQQANCEKDEELISTRIRIQELEALVASWQKENEGVKQEQLLTMENEMLKNEIDNLKKYVMELEVEGQQNLQQQIHHHAKIKEENNVLKAQNDEISHKLKRAEVIIRRVKEELANLRATSERKPC